MSGGNLSPRQKMINMMYLVLMAMLALNVSAEILKAFYLVEQSMIKAGTNIEAKNDDYIRQFKKQMENQAEKTKPYYEKAKEAVKIADDFIKYVEELKTEIVTQGGKKTLEEARQEDGQLLAKDNIEVHAHLLVAESGPKKGAELHQKVNDTREALLKVLTDIKAVTGVDLSGEAKRIREQSDLIAENTETQTWESELFEHSPQAAVVTLLTKIQNDAKNTLSDVLAELFRGITAKEMSFDKLVAKIIPKATSVAAGETFEADIILTAYDSKQANQVIVNGKEVPSEAGVAKLSIPAGGIGTHKVEGKIIVSGKEGEVAYPFTKEYNVYKGAVSVSADKMNMLYIGLDNPITVAVPGYTPEQISASITSGTLVKQGGGQYLARVSKRGDVKINVSVMEDGKSKSMGSMSFRVRSIPKPEARLGTLESGTHSAGAIQAQNAVYGVLGDGFAYEGINYKIQRYMFTYSPRRGDATFVVANGGGVPPQAKGIMGRLRTGDKVIIDNIEATGPDGKRPLAPIVITVR